jgi:hypothetical protein
MAAAENVFVPSEATAAVQSAERVEGVAMPRLFSRRAMVAAGGAAALVPVAIASVSRAAPPSGSLITLLTPIRIYDSRSDAVPLGGAKLASGETVIVTVSVPDETRFLTAAFLNVTVTQTEGSGFLRVNGTDASGTQPIPATSNVNWSQNGQTLANLVLTTVGSEFGVDVFAGGGGRTHVIVDLQGYVPFE